MTDAIPPGKQRPCVAVTALVALGAVWGGSFVIQRKTAAAFGPFPLVFVRLVLGSLVLAPFLWRARACFNRAVWLRIAGVGLLTSAIPFALFAWGAEQAPAAIGAITNALTAPFAALVGWMLFRESMPLLRAFGILLGFCGVVALVGVHTQGGVAVAALAGTSASLCYGIGGQVLRRWFSGIPAPALASATLGTGAIILLTPAILSWPTAPLSLTLWSGAVILGTVCTGSAYALYFWLIAGIGAARAATATYLVPLFALLLAWLFLGEQPSWTWVGAGGLIIAGVLISQSAPSSVRSA